MYAHYSNLEKPQWEEVNVAISESLAVAAVLRYLESGKKG